MKAKDLLADEGRWMKEGFARAADGGSIMPDSPYAVRWCLSGALRRCYPEEFDFRRAYDNVRALLPGNQILSEWNDLPGTTFADVKALLERADV
jgi:hypothetical protein